MVEYGGDLRLHDYQGLLPRDWAEEAGSKYNKKVNNFVLVMQFFLFHFFDWLCSANCFRTYINFCITNRSVKLDFCESHGAMPTQNCAF